MSGQFLVRTGEFEGPLDLLLNLIEKRKLHISDVSLAQVTDDFIGHTEGLANVTTADIAQFILTAATLMLIKSRALLPKVKLSQEENASMEKLELRLKLLQIFRDLGASHIKRLFGKHILFDRKKSTQSEAVVFSPPTTLSAEKLEEGISSALLSLPIQESLPQTTVRKVVSLEETMSNLLNRVQEGLKMDFREFTGARGSKKRISGEKKQHIIVSFLAVLELARRGALTISQNEQFGDISLETLDVDTPRYV